MVASLIFITFCVLTLVYIILELFNSGGGDGIVYR